MSQATIFCPFCGSEIKLDQTSRGTNINVPTILKGVGVAVAGTCAVATAVGFAPAGIAAGSVATVWQASVGNVAAGSAFATLQSIGATGGFYSGMAFGGTAFGAGKLWESQNNTSSEGVYYNEDDGDEGGDGDEQKHGSDVNKSTSDGNGSNQDEADDGTISLKCPHCNRSFQKSMATSGTANNAVDDGAERIAQ